MSPGNTGEWRPAPDGPAFVLLIQQHYDEWLRYLMQQRVPQADAEVLLDQVIYEKLAPDPTFDPGRPGANAFVRQQLWWHAQSYHRSPRGRTAGGLGGGTDNDPGQGLSDRREPPPPAAAMTAEARRRLWEAVQNLKNERHRFAVILCYWLGMNAARIAALCNGQAAFSERGAVTEGAVTMWLHYGRNELREQLPGDLIPE
jgi:DNA-directed RNA polymerase specialized sigma24 family protein